jgi:lysine/arginine/ornithine transport system substrate-binding protein
MRRIPLRYVFALSLGAGCSSSKPATQPKPAAFLPEFVVPNSRNSPFSPVVKVGNVLYVSGQLGTGAGQGGVGPETTAALNRISQLLKLAGSSMERVAKCTVMLDDMKNWNAMNEAYIAFFPPDKRPARSSFGATALAQGGHVEIECIATVD